MEHFECSPAYTYGQAIKDDLVCLSKKHAGKLGNIGQVLICLRVTSTIQLIDPSTLQIREIQEIFKYKNGYQGHLFKIAQKINS